MKRVDRSSRRCRTLQMKAQKNGATNSRPPARTMAGLISTGWPKKKRSGSCTSCSSHLTIGNGASSSLLASSATTGARGFVFAPRATLAALQPGLVCLVDANLRSPWLHDLVGADRRYGLASAGGFGQASVTAFARPLCANKTNSLWVLPSGSSESDPATLLTLARVQPRLRELSSRFEHILICAPPADLHAESLALGQAVDGVVLVVSANATRRDTVARVKSRFDDLGVPMLGVVLNDRTYPIPQSLYRLV